MTLASLENLMFGDYTVADLLQEDRIYKEVTDIPRLDSVIMSYITDYNNTNKTRLNLILFQYVVKFSFSLRQMEEITNFFDKICFETPESNKSSVADFGRPCITYWSRWIGKTIPNEAGSFHGRIHAVSADCKT